MKVQRGDAVLTRVPHPGGGRGKKRPAVVIPANRYNQSERLVIVAEITTNLTRASDRPCARRGGDSGRESHWPRSRLTDLFAAGDDE